MASASWEPAGAALLGSGDGLIEQPMESGREVPASTLDAFIETDDHCAIFCAQCGAFCLAGFIHCVKEYGGCAFLGTQCGEASDHQGCKCICHFEPP